MKQVSAGDGPAMMTNSATIESLRRHAARTAQKVVIVNGSPEMLDMLEAVLDAGHYDIVFVESSEHAYSQIKRVQPDLVILCVRIEDADGFLVLSMLKLDADTRAIPVLTYTNDESDEEVDTDYAETSEAEVWMN
jgi:PleD family two-component response regulator